MDLRNDTGCLLSRTYETRVGRLIEDIDNEEIKTIVENVVIKSLKIYLIIKKKLIKIYNV